MVGLDSILNCIAPAGITYICLADVSLPKKRLKSLPKSLSPFVNVEILLLRGLRLPSLSGCKFPNLRFLDLSHNNITRVTFSSSSFLYFSFFFLFSFFLSFPFFLFFFSDCFLNVSSSLFLLY